MYFYHKYFAGNSLFNGTNLLNGLVEENQTNANDATMPWGHILNTHQWRSQTNATNVTMHTPI